MKCILCKHDLQIFSESSFFGSFVYKCDTCNFFINDETEESMKKRLVSLYKKNYWDKAEHDSILSGYKDTDSQGKRRNWVSQYAYTKSMIVADLINSVPDLERTISWIFPPSPRPSTYCDSTT